VTALSSLRQALAAARSRAALIPGLGDLITAIETHLVTEAARLTSVSDTVNELTHLESRIRTLESIVSTVPRDVPAALAELRAKIDAIDRKHDTPPPCECDEGAHQVNPACPYHGEGR